MTDHDRTVDDPAAAVLRAADKVIDSEFRWLADNGALRQAVDAWRAAGRPGVPPTSPAEREEHKCPLAGFVVTESLCERCATTCDFRWMDELPPTPPTERGEKAWCMENCPWPEKWIIENTDSISHGVGESLTDVVTELQEAREEIKRLKLVPPAERGEPTLEERWEASMTALERCREAFSELAPDEWDEFNECIKPAGYQPPTPPAERGAVAKLRSLRRWAVDELKAIREFKEMGPQSESACMLECFIAHIDDPPTPPAERGECERCKVLQSRLDEVLVKRLAEHRPPTPPAERGEECEQVKVLLARLEAYEEPRDAREGISLTCPMPSDPLAVVEIREWVKGASVSVIARSMETEMVDRYALEEYLDTLHSQRVRVVEGEVTYAGEHWFRVVCDGLSARVGTPVKVLIEDPE